jgi:hypothetical protein
MRYGFVLISTLFIAFSSCKKEKEPVTPPHSVPEEPPIAVALLKDITIPNLPSPYYHFEYTASGTASFASFASGFNQYNLVYSNGRIHQMRNNIVVNKDTIQYLYDNADRVDRINYIAEGGNVYVKISLAYDAQKLIKIDREKKLGNNFILDKTMTMSYHADGNLKDLTYHYFPFNGSAEHIFTDHFDQYDSKVNVDAFGLLHNEFFDHLVLLPGVQLQKNNPLKESRTGDAANYNITYTYTYNDKNHPVNKKGDLVFTTGTDTGKRFQTNSFYSYY